MSRLLLVCSSGGHLFEMFTLYDDVWAEHERVWVTFRKPDAESMLARERVIWAFGPTHRSILNLFRNMHLAIRVLLSVKPDAIFSTGSGVALPFFCVAKVLGIRTMFLESITRTRNLSLTGRLIYRVADEFLVQSATLLKDYPRSKYMGRIF